MSELFVVETQVYMSLTSSDSHSGLMQSSVSVVTLPALTVSNLCLVFSSEGVRFFGM